MIITPLLSHTTHIRSGVKDNNFTYSFLSVCVELDEDKNEKPWWLSFNSFGLFSLFEDDYFRVGDLNCSLKQRLSIYIGEEILRLRMLGGIRFFGYIFNPLTMYYIETIKNEKIVVGEIWNTFGELKPFVIREENFNDYQFDKNFYISPFMNVMSKLKISISWPSETNFEIQVISNDSKDRLFANWKTQKLGNNLLLLFPYSLRVSYLIHWQALKLFLKKIKFYKKTENANFQKGFFLWK